MTIEEYEEQKRIFDSMPEKDQIKQILEDTKKFWYYCKGVDVDFELELKAKLERIQHPHYAMTFIKPIVVSCTKTAHVEGVVYFGNNMSLIIAKIDFVKTNDVRNIKTGKRHKENVNLGYDFVIINPQNQPLESYCEERFKELLKIK